MSEPITNLIYTTFGYDINWFKIILLLLNSVEKCVDIKTFDFLIICDDNMFEIIHQYIKTNCNYSFNIKLHNSKKNSTTPMLASINKLGIFDFEEINNYSKILFIDGDIISTLNLNNLFNHELRDDILYVYKEVEEIDAHRKILWSLENYTEDEIELFREKSIYPFNCGIFLFKNTDILKLDFDKINEIILNHQGKFFYEQSFMNYYFNRKGTVNYEIITNDNYIMFPDLSVKYTDKIIHFCGAGNKNKFETIMNYLNTHSL